MKPKNTICLWFDNDAHAAARFYAATFPDSKVTAVHKAPGDYPGGKAGDELTVEFTVVGFPSRSPPTTRKRRTATGTRSSAMAARKVRAVGARTGGACHGRSLRARSPMRWRRAAPRQGVPSRR
jgi:hypothetical protein